MACGAWTPRTDSRASVPRPGPSTPAARSRANRGTTRWGSWASTSCRPRAACRPVLEERIAELQTERTANGAAAEANAEELRRLGAAVPVRSAGVVALTGSTKDELALRVGEEKLAALRTADASLSDRLEAAQRELALARAGDQGDPPTGPPASRPAATTRRGAPVRAPVEFWSAISAGALLIFIVATLYLSVLGPAAAVVVAIAGYVAIEAASRRRLIETLLRATLVLAVAGAVVLVVTNLPLILVAVIAGIALLAIIDNLRELRA